VTERCQLRCQHCYQDSYGGRETGLEEWREVLAQLEAWRLAVRAPGHPLPWLHLNLTGGEPFLHRDFLGLLDLLAARPDRFSFAILSNGQGVDGALARRLAALGPRFVQVSLEGGPATHDDLRGTGSFARTVEGVRHLTRAGVPVIIAFTAHRGNYREFPEVARWGAVLGARRVWADRWIPAGPVVGRPGLETLSPRETREFLGLLREAREREERRWLRRTEVTQFRALQFLTGLAEPYHCEAGASLLALLPNGDLLPCRRLPVRVGNVFERPLADWYREHPFLRALRNPQLRIRGCEGCAFRRACRGGLRCLAYACGGDPFVSDPGCWLARNGREMGKARAPIEADTDAESRARSVRAGVSRWERREEKRGAEGRSGGFTTDFAAKSAGPWPGTANVGERVRGSPNY
jgi:radical SAM protein with 4Fe4S-binding SPASM domain